MQIRPDIFTDSISGFVRRARTRGRALVSSLRPDGEMDIITAFEAVVPGSNPGRGTIESARTCPEARLGDVRTGFEDLASILWSILMRTENPQGVLIL